MLNGLISICLEICCEIDFAWIQKVSFSISYKFVQNPQISDCSSLPLDTRSHGLLAGSFRKLSYSWDFLFHYRESSVLDHCNCSALKATHVESVPDLSSDGSGEGVELPCYIYVWEGRWLDPVRSGYFQGMGWWREALQLLPGTSGIFFIFWS